MLKRQYSFLGPRELMESLLLFFCYSDKPDRGKPNRGGLHPPRKVISLGLNSHYFI